MKRKLQIDFKLSSIFRFDKYLLMLTAQYVESNTQELFVFLH